MFRRRRTTLVLFFPLWALRAGPLRPWFFRSGPYGPGRSGPGSSALGLPAGAAQALVLPLWAGSDCGYPRCGDRIGHRVAKMLGE